MAEILSFLFPLMIYSASSSALKAYHGDAPGVLVTADDLWCLHLSLKHLKIQKQMPLVFPIGITHFICESLQAIISPASSVDSQIFSHSQLLATPGI